MSATTTSHRRAAASSASVLLTLLLAAGCTYYTRPARSQEQLLALREKDRQETAADDDALFSELIRHTKTEYDQYHAGHRLAPPTVDILIISGGGDWGAFGAGFLKGWGCVPKSHPLARPDFDVVTGVSTGALIAPFAFIGTDQAYDRVLHLYRHPNKDWVQQRGPLYFLPNHISFAKVPGLEREVRDNITPDLIHQIADRGTGGRVLAVNTTNIDDGSPRIFDLVEESRRAIATRDYERLRQIMLASAGIPGAFPFRIIDHEMYVDGGVTGNVIYGGHMEDEDAFPAVWQRTYPDLPTPRVRYWVVFNNMMKPAPQVTEPNWPAVVVRSLEIATRSSTKTALRHLHAMAENTRHERHADVEVRTAAIPNNWLPPVLGPFEKETMNALADLGEKMGADPASWSTEPPPR